MRAGGDGSGDVFARVGAVERLADIFSPVRQVKIAHQDTATVVISGA
jgi:hypothetical protein